MQAQGELSPHDGIGDLRSLFPFLHGLLAAAAGQLSEVQQKASQNVPESKQPPNPTIKKHCSNGSLEALQALFNFSPKLWAGSFLWSTQEGQSSAAPAVGGKGLHLPAHHAGTCTSTKQSAPH